MFSWPEPAKRLAIAIRAAEHADRNSLAVNLDILATVMPGEHVETTAETKKVAERVGRVVAAADPSNGYLALAGWLATGTESEPLTAGDLAALEAAIAAPRFEVPRRALLEQLRALAATVDPEYAELRAQRIARHARPGIPALAARRGHQGSGAPPTHRCRHAGRGRPPRLFVRYSSGWSALSWPARGPTWPARQRSQPSARLKTRCRRGEGR